MAITIWTSTDVKQASGTRLASGAEVSVALWRQSSTYTLRFKRSDDGGRTWPSDASATTVATLAGRGVWRVYELDGVLYLVSGTALVYESKSSGILTGHWAVMTA